MKIGGVKIRIAEKAHDGIFYWIPKPDGTWDHDILLFHGDQSGESQTHVALWRRSTLNKLIRAWCCAEVAKEQLRNAYRGIPRGRVFKLPDGTWQIRIGIEFLDGDISVIDKICEEFGLVALRSNGLVTSHMWDHENCVDADVKKLEKAGVEWR